MTLSPSTSAVVIGASGGIGQALVSRLVASEAYAPIFALARSQPSGLQGVRTQAIDLGDEASIAAAAARVGEAGPVGLVIVATGILHQDGVSPEKTVKALDPAAMAAVFSINTIGPALIAKHFVPLLARTGRCVFAALSARVGSIEDNRLGGWYAYRASKAALNQILKTLAIEVARSRPEAIVVGLHPGTVASNLSRPFRPDPNAEGVLQPDESAGHLLRVLGTLDVQDTGGVFAWDGTRVPA
ncbi:MULTISPECIES: SDR family NAD(P)-dependent oxidoreductase [unclassified Methylobacterium]|jgi:NAD(P)-dependent dehydrogenase (short-subunit alcohol dehydrogenase family)|uniref:SDR family NAD(P)-dependent oxidoreductase n=1 Tax=unclassified Methylobacterium TaxID=2615210 RepID=UPI0013554496|nr:SDR family NAD(P)-dependent oxidoreductase [Methylobacterium sp. 2A]MWV20530.1 SDR family NAD(P)-dependent oxidoreductase [Methylobacterium sp. 2A]